MERLAAALEATAGDARWEVRAEVAASVQHLRHPSFDRIVMALLGDGHEFVRRAALASQRRRRQAVQAAESYLDEIDDVEARLDRLGVDHSPELADAARELALAYLSALVAETTHDAKTSYAVVSEAHRRLAAVLEERGVPRVEWQEPLESATRRARVMYTTIRNMKQFATRSTTERERLVVRRLVDEVVRDVLDCVRPTGKRIAVQIDDALEVFAPRDLLIRALHNLITNAVEAVGPEGHVDVVGTACAERPDHVAVMVVDDGCGIAAENLERVFLPGQSSKKGRPGSENTGWGLTNAKRIVERDCRGELSLESDLGLGTTVTILLPCVADEDDGDEGAKS